MRTRERKVHMELNSSNRVLLWAEMEFINQVQQMRGVAKVAQRSSGGYELYFDPRFEPTWLLGQLITLAAHEERGGDRWVM